MVYIQKVERGPPNMIRFVLSQTQQTSTNVRTMYIVNCIPHNTDNIDIIASNLTTLYKNNNNNFLLSHCNKCHDRDEKSAPETREMDVALIVFSPGQSRSITYKKQYHICYIWEGMVLETWQ